MNITLKATTHKFQENIQVTGSKSESNRLLLLQALYPNIKIDNLSNSDDSQYMQKALGTDHETFSTIKGENTGQRIVDIHHAGTAMRFLTAYFSVQEGRETVLTGSKRMTERPVGILVDALRQLGADISYLKEEGYPPLLIKGKKLIKNKLAMAANVSSQYISALLLIAPKLENGIELSLEGKITSVPYINMTLGLLTDLGIETSFKDNVIKVFPKQKVKDMTMVVESDWSSASYFYSIIAMGEVGSEIVLSSYKQHSLQGDSALVEIYKQFGVETGFNEHSVVLRKIGHSQQSMVNFDLSNSPDIAQTIAVTCFGLGVGCDLTGLHTLKIKETDRLEALKTELTRLGADIAVTNKSLHLKPSSAINPNISIPTYQDHRMAMAFAPLGIKVPVGIEEAEVVSKSYPDFWKDLEQIGFAIQQ